ncbi:hypothetical protein V1517DRAFT_291846 [Lipomyces orientalis]|uniref:Uncharacterized protein n=1 Tax=Lipomyces orientalis TaxID=1233043 RepID=A0ACC3TMF8_9ASCO
MDKIKFFVNLWPEIRPPMAVFTEKDVPDLAGKVFFVTGGSSGVGLELCRVLYHVGGRVIVGGRSEKDYLNAVENIKAHPGMDLRTCPKGSLEFLYLDLSDLTTIKPAAQELLSKVDRLDVVWYNAGVMVPPVGSKTKQGYELQWGTNVVAHFLLNRLISPLQIKTAQSSPASSVRTIWVSSSAHHLSPDPHGINFADINYERSKERPDQMTIYGQSKAGSVICAYEYARQISDKGIVSLALNPGGLKTNLQRNIGFLARHAMGLLLYPARMGSLTELYAGFAPELTAKKGFLYIIPWGRIGPFNKKVQRGLEQNNTSKKLWGILDEETKKYM